MRGLGLKPAVGTGRGRVGGGVLVAEASRSARLERVTAGLRARLEPALSKGNPGN